jgi:hypothetical protein
MHIRTSFIGLFSMLGVSAFYAVRADIIVNQPNADISGNGRDPGQSFTTPSFGSDLLLTEVDFGGDLNNGESGTGEPGNLFLLSQQYLGSPLLLSSATPGFLAESNLGSIYFDSSFGIYGSTAVSFSFTSGGGLELVPGSQYWVYDNSATGWDPQWTDNQAYTGGNLYMAVPQGTSSDNTYGGSSYPTTTSYQFKVQATPLGVPEPTAWILLLLNSPIVVYILRKARGAKHLSCSKRQSFAN